MKKNYYPQDLRFMESLKLAEKDKKWANIY